MKTFDQTTVLSRSGGTCVRCGKPIKKGTYYTMLERPQDSTEDDYMVHHECTIKASHRVHAACDRQIREYAKRIKELELELFDANQEIRKIALMMAREVSEGPPSALEIS